MSRTPQHIFSGREARRSAQFGPGVRRKGAGWTRKFRKGREQRQLYIEKEESHE